MTRFIVAPPQLMVCGQARVVRHEARPKRRAKPLTQNVQAVTAKEGQAAVTKAAAAAAVAAAAAAAAASLPTSGPTQFVSH